MQLQLNGHGYRYECENLCRLFFPYSHVQVVGSLAPGEGEPWALAAVEPCQGGYRYTARVGDGQEVVGKTCTHHTLEEYAMTDLLYSAFVGLTGISPAWGMLTGIHPVKLLRQYVEGLGEEAGVGRFRSRCHVSESRASLALRTLREQGPVTAALGEDDWALYIALLLAELEKTAAVTQALGLRLVAVYVGGGTPTTLTAGQLGQLCQAVHSLFDLSHCLEFTVEAGRPDTITREKLEALKAGGVTRISINPQTLSDQVLQNIGRLHTAQDVLDAFALAGTAGFTDINCDLIVGLPGDSLAGFEKTLEGVLALGPSNVTVHSLALKRAARIEAEGGTGLHKKQEETAAMMGYSIRRLTEEGYAPYYLYRQTRMAGNLENTGWAKPGFACRYNIYTMDECTSVVACGAGGVTKLKDPYSGRLERIFNFKYPAEYISRHGEILDRKDGVTRLYEQFRKRLH